jgi:hypothetical protein
MKDWWGGRLAGGARAVVFDASSAHSPAPGSCLEEWPGARERASEKRARTESRRNAAPRAAARRCAPARRTRPLHLPSPPPTAPARRPPQVPVQRGILAHLPGRRERPLRLRNQGAPPRGDAPAWRPAPGHGGWSPDARTGNRRALSSREELGRIGAPKRATNPQRRLANIAPASQPPPLGCHPLNPPPPPPTLSTPCRTGLGRTLSWSPCSAPSGGS